ncbi:Nucleic-acid-binding protein from transposon X-element [Eumeta japonica]|uniref:Nucleic-acid-binding protein from transposon X-element n=1 Tax=Eumeta variegata TaxID=151549 RepID=A0A4C1YBC8_EUMVA|nr:Nucleic-acid-binding protein from transposon X-element [Eumeta japonica]
MKDCAEDFASGKVFSERRGPRREPCTTRVFGIGKKKNPACVNWQVEAKTKIILMCRELLVLCYGGATRKLPVRRVYAMPSPRPPPPPPPAWTRPPLSQSVLGRGPGRALHRCSESPAGLRVRVASHEYHREQKRYVQYIPATFCDVNTAVCKTSRTKEVRPRDLCKDTPRCPDEPNKEVFNNVRWMTGHIGYPCPPHCSTAARDARRTGAATAVRAICAHYTPDRRTLSSLTRPASQLPPPSHERRAAARNVPSEILMRDISDPARSRRIPNPILRAGHSGIPVPVSRHPLPEPAGSVEEETEIGTDTSSGSSTESGKKDYDHDTITGAMATAVKRSRDALSSLSHTQESAPKKANRRSSINAEMPRSPSPEPYAEITLNSTAYAALAVEAGEGREHYLSPPPTLSPIKAYAAVAASPPRPKSQLQDNERRISPGPPTAVTGTDVVITTVQSDVAADAGATTQGVRGYPPLVVESLPNWVSHFEELRRLLGRTPKAPPFGKGVRFLPKSDTELRTVQRYLQAAARKDSHITWFCYAPVIERPTKIGIRGLPVDTAPDAIIKALQELGFPAEYAQPIPLRKRRPECLFYARLGHTDQDGLQRLYGMNTLLNMPGVTIEGWRGRAGPPQCHRCQAFGHSSANCHRPQRCVRCGERHLAADCPRPRDQKPTCANCQGPHPASDKRCPAFRREARQRGITIPPPIPTEQDSTTLHRRGQGAGEARRLDATAPPHNAPDNDRPTGRRTRTRAVNSSAGAASELARQARAGHPNQGTESGETQYGRKAKREAEEVEKRSIPSPASPASIRRPANAPAYTRLPRIQTRSSDNDDGATSDTNGAANATDSSHAAPDNAADLPATSGNAIDEPTNLRAPPSPGDPRLPTTGAAHLDVGAGDGGLAGNTNRPGSGHGSASGITSRPRRAPADLRGKMQDLRALVQSQDIHIVLLGKTKLRPRQQLRLPNFFVNRRDEVSPRGIAFRGTAVLVRRAIVHGGLEQIIPPPPRLAHQKGDKGRNAESEGPLHLF